MKPVVTDIDIDVPNRDVILKLFKHTVASNHSKGKPRRHNTGVYFHKVPSDPFTWRCTLDYNTAEDLGYFKIDILNVSIYKTVRDPAHMDQLLATEPIWELLEEQDFCDMLFHIRGHHGVCKQMKPKNIIQLAAVLAMIRPAKRHLIGMNWKSVMNDVWIAPTDDSYAFKKSHSLGYALAVKLHMNLLTEQFMNESN